VGTNGRELAEVMATEICQKGEQSHTVAGGGLTLTIQAGKKAKAMCLGMDVNRVVLSYLLLDSIF
jgi:hypothetical protein